MFSAGGDFIPCKEEIPVIKEFLFISLYVSYDLLISGEYILTPHFLSS